jgi:outer membrane biosynthesis protein TonB
MPVEKETVEPVEETFTQVEETEIIQEPEPVSDKKEEVPRDKIDMGTSLEPVGDVSFVDVESDSEILESEPNGVFDDAVLRCANKWLVNRLDGRPLEKNLCVKQKITMKLPKEGS